MALRNPGTLGSRGGAADIVRGERPGNDRIVGAGDRISSPNNTAYTTASIWRANSTTVDGGIQLAVSKPSLKTRIMVRLGEWPRRMSAVYTASNSAVAPDAVTASSAAPSAARSALSRAGRVTSCENVRSDALSCGERCAASVRAASRRCCSGSPARLSLRSG